MSAARKLDPSSYVQIRLTINRAGEGQLSWGLVVRTVGGGQRRDQLRARGVADSPPQGLASSDPVEALLAIARQIDERRGPRRAAASGAPQGPTGVACPGQLRLDLPS
jgi:hypothetical protein